MKRDKINETRVLKIRGHDEEAEIGFELNWLLSLSCEERVNLMLERSRMLMEMLAQNGHPVITTLLKRK